MMLTVRDRWLCATLPALLTIIIGYAVVLRPAIKETRLVRSKLARMDPAGAQEARLERARFANTELKGELSALMKSAPGAEIPDEGRSDARRLALLHELSQFCDRSGLLLVSASPIPRQDEANEVSPSDRQLLSHAGWAGAELWRLDIRGSYRAVLGLLETVAGNAPFVVPCGLSMDPVGDNTEPGGWRLTVWM